METILSLHNGDEFLIALTDLIKRLAVDHLHILGDIYDRGPHADKILDLLMEHHSVDIQWGNHDILWMGAFAAIRCAWHLSSEIILNIRLCRYLRMAME